MTWLCSCLIMFLNIALTVVAQDDFDYDSENFLTRSRPSTEGGTCTKQCGIGFKCEEKPCTCQVCVKEPLSCKTFECAPSQKCRDTARGPICIQTTCADLSCAAGFICNETPDGPDCVPDVPSCVNFFCRRGTNCYIRGGSPICLPNTCAIRVCSQGLTCVDTPYGALCRRGKKKHGCKNKYCPENSKCEDQPKRGPICVPI